MDIAKSPEVSAEKAMPGPDRILYLSQSGGSKQIRPCQTGRCRNQERDGPANGIPLPQEGPSQKHEKTDTIRTSVTPTRKPRSSHSTRMTRPDPCA